VAIKLFVGLGNPGLLYRDTRHNLGFQVVEAFARRHRIRIAERAYGGKVGRGQVAGNDVVLLLPHTYMNLSGLSVQQAVRQLKITPQEMVVVVDDLDLPPGKIRLRRRGSAGGHNGLRSIVESLGTEDFPRLRIGIGRPEGHQVVEHVLGYFSPQEHTLVHRAIEDAVAVLDALAAQGLDAAIDRMGVLIKGEGGS
jgi:PTH1 family peptidyl-tRNA hydrolase